MHCFLICIGDDCTFTAKVHILAHDASTKKHLGFTKIGKVIVGNGVFLGVGVVVLPGVTIGDDAIVGAGSVVTKSILPKEVWGEFRQKRYAPWRNTYRNTWANQALGMNTSCPGDCQTKGNKKCVRQ